MVAFVTSLLIGLAGFGAVLVYGRRRPIGAPLSWGQAMLAATFAFLMFFWWYGVIPHQWLTVADGNELGWRKDKYVIHSGEAPFGLPGMDWWPIDITWEVLRDVIVVGIYGVGLGLHVLVWAKWQDRAKERPVVVPASRYGRPLVRKG